jgi:hypothetical protein
MRSFVFTRTDQFEKNPLVQYFNAKASNRFQIFHGKTQQENEFSCALEILAEMNRRRGLRKDHACQGVCVLCEILKFFQRKKDEDIVLALELFQKIQRSYPEILCDAKADKIFEKIIRSFREKSGIKGFSAGANKISFELSCSCGIFYGKKINKSQNFIELNLDEYTVPIPNTHFQYLHLTSLYAMIALSKYHNLHQTLEDEILSRLQQSSYYHSSNQIHFIKSRNAFFCDSFPENLTFSLTLNSRSLKKCSLTYRILQLLIKFPNSIDLKSTDNQQSYYLQSLIVHDNDSSFNIIRSENNKWYKVNFKEGNLIGNGSWYNAILNIGYFKLIPSILIYDTTPQPSLNLSNPEILLLEKIGLLMSQNENSKIDISMAEILLNPHTFPETTVMKCNFCNSEKLEGIECLNCRFKYCKKYCSQGHELVWGEYCCSFCHERLYFIPDAIPFQCDMCGLMNEGTLSCLCCPTKECCECRSVIYSGESCYQKSIKTFCLSSQIQDHEAVVCANCRREEYFSSID